MPVSFQLSAPPASVEPTPANTAPVEADEGAVEALRRHVPDAFREKLHAGRLRRGGSRGEVHADG